VVEEKTWLEEPARGAARPFQPGLSAEAVRAQLERIVASATFRASDGLVRFLRFVVEETLLGHAESLKESVIGVEVFRRGKTFDPRMDAIVRVDARRLRGKLAEYYASAGRNDPVFIEVRKGSYAPVFSPGAPVPAVSPKTAMNADSRFSSIAVLPFINLSTDPENEYFSDGLTEEVIAALARIPNLHVIARSTAFRYQGKSHDIPRVGAELHVEAVLEGSVRRTGERMRIGAQLIDVSTCFHIWSRTFECDTKDIFAVQREISTAIEQMVKGRVTCTSHAGVKDVSENHEAYDLYLRGIYCGSKRSAGALAEGLAYLQRAAALDPESALIFARLADSWALQSLYGIEPPDAAMPFAKAAADRALEIDGGLAEAHAARALVSALYDWDWPAADAGFQRALALNPGVSEIYHRYALYYLAPAGRTDEAVRAVRHAKSLDPLSLVLSAAECICLFWSRQYDESIACGRRTLELDPTHSLTHTYMVSPYQSKGMLDEALETAQAAVRFSGGTPLSLRQLGTTYALMGRADDALVVIDQLKARTHVPTPMISDIYVALGDSNSAFEWLEKARILRAPGLVYMQVAPRNDRLKLDPRFGPLVRQIGVGGGL
jgi:TolB-like protein/tetratricopeptide (TPR) repeat protein